MKFWDYILAPWEGPDGKLALRPIMATVTLIGLIMYIERHINPDSRVMDSYTLLIALLLGISATQYIAEKAIASKAPTNTTTATVSTTTTETPAPK
ncbi:MAG: hypothetical protein JWO03_2869 [Bacteroidetes bacterium]|nr:hypothetical protein [Bacteroidota bacterium]